MTATAAMIGYNNAFAIDDIPTSGGFVEIGESKDIAPPNLTVAVVDATHNKSPNAIKESIPGMIDPGECKVPLAFIPGSGADTRIQAVILARKKVSCRITYSNGWTWTFEGFATNYAPTAPTEDRMTAEVSFRLTAGYVAAPPVAPANTVLPAISGVAQVGQALRVLTGTWTNAPAFTYQWKKGGVNIAGATAEIYAPVVGDVGAAITVVVTAANAAGNATATSAATANVIAA